MLIILICKWTKILTEESPNLQLINPQGVGKGGRLWNWSTGPEDFSFLSCHSFTVLFLALSFSQSPNTTTFQKFLGNISLFCLILLIHETRKLRHKSSVSRSLSMLQLCLHQIVLPSTQGHISSRGCFNGIVCLA